MTYATLTDLIDRYGEAMLIGLTDRGAAPTGAVVTSVVDAALADADAVIDGYLLTRYALPLSTVPDLIVTLAEAIAIYTLHTYEPDPKITKDYEAAIRSLRDISGGVIRLQVAGSEPADVGGTGVQITDRERPLTAENMKGFI